MKNVDPRTVEGFGREWRRFDQSQMSDAERHEMFGQYFSIFPWDALPSDAVGMDVGCGSGRWAGLVAPRVGVLHCIDASEEALKVARRNLGAHENCRFYRASVSDLPIEDSSLDFGYCLGVLHHVPDTLGGLTECVKKLKPGAPLLLYMYYAFDHKPLWFRLLWRMSDLLRRPISRLPEVPKTVLSALFAALVYLPLARTAAFAERSGLRVDNFPLSYYRRRSFYTMRTDALDRFGTRLEQRFKLDELHDLMAAVNLERITVSPTAPYWCAVGYRSLKPKT